LFASRTKTPRRLFGILPMRHDRGIGLIYAASLGAWTFAGVQPFLSLRAAGATGAVVAAAFQLEFERLDRRKVKKGDVMEARSQIPARYLDDDGADFAAPTSSLLVALGLLGEENAYKPDGLNELQEGALSFSKWVGGLAGSAGLAGVVTSIVSAFTHAHEPTRVALIAGGSLIAAAAVIAVALVVQADARARAQSTAAQYAARSEVSAAFLALADGVLGPAGDESTTNHSRRLRTGRRRVASGPPTRSRGAG
jgi:hypothetical protein